MAGQRGGPARSLKARAIQLLALREQSRVELRRKLLLHAVAEIDAAQGVLPEAPGAGRGRSGRGTERAASVFDVPGAGAAGGVGTTTTAAAAVAAGIAPLDARDAIAVAADKVDVLLDWLAANGYLSAERFIESRVQARSARFGNLRIRRELQEHRLTLPPAALERLQASELSRARALHDRRFGGPPADAAERARRARFLSGRGFPFDVISRVLDKPPDDDEFD